MIRKRTMLSDICDMKRKKLNNHDVQACNDDTPTDTVGALKHISALFPTVKFKNHLPPIVMMHQIYAFVKSKTEVDRQLNELRQQGEILLIRLGLHDNRMAVVYFKDYNEYCERICKNNQLVSKFLNTVVKECHNICYNKHTLRSSYGFYDEQIIELVQQGVLTMVYSGCFSLSIPQVGVFVKTFLYGYRATLQYVRRTKYKEILKSELMQRKLPRKAILGISYHIYDIIGSQAVVCIETSMGIVLRLEAKLDNK